MHLIAAWSVPDKHLILTCSLSVILPRRHGIFDRKNSRKTQDNFASPAQLHADHAPEKRR
jgi:hypothetical protein